jgi:hypothetical protein
MSENHTSIESYQVYHYTTDLGSEVTAKISCFREEKLIGEIQFYKDGGSIPKSLSAAGKFLIRYSDLRFKEVIATFRRSSSMTISFDSDKEEFSIVSGRQSIQ